MVEAKNNEVEVGEGVAQAKLYMQKLRLNTAFVANGKEIYEIDLKANTEGKVAQFPTPEQLWQRSFGASNAWQKRFNAVPFEDINATKPVRYYQELAVNYALESIAKDRQRLLLTDVV